MATHGSILADNLNQPDATAWKLHIIRLEADK